MSEPGHERVEHADRVDHADTVNTAGTVSEVHVHRDAPVGRTPEDKKFRLVLAAAGLMFLMVMAIVLGLCVYFIVDRGNVADDARADAAKSREAIQLLSDQVDDLQRQLDTRDVAKEERDVCTAAYSRNITSSSQDAFSQLIDFVIPVRNPSQPATDRQAAYDEGVKLLQQANNTYRFAVADRDQWVASGQPLPCPIPAPTAG